MKTMRGSLLALCTLAAPVLAGIDAAEAQERGRPPVSALAPPPLDIPAETNLGLKLFEVEVGGGVTLAPAWEGTRGRAGGNFFAELRLNRPEPWDVGLQFKGANFSHTVGGARIGTMTVNPALFIDYNLRTWRRTEFFAGVGVGGSFAYNDAVVMTFPSSGVWVSGNEGAFAVTPRVGLHLGWLRVTAEYTITARRYSRAGISVGIVMGGSARRTRAERKARRPKLWDDIAAPIIIDHLERRRYR